MAKPSAPVWDEKHLRMGVTAAGIALWSWNVDSDALTMDEIGHALWTVPHDVPVTFEDLSAHIHPADRDRVRVAFNMAAAPLAAAIRLDPEAPRVALVVNRRG